MKTSLIQIEKSDDLFSILDKISWCKSRRVILRWNDTPEGIEYLEIKRILMYCNQIGIQVAFVGGGHLVKTIAKNLGIAVFTSAALAEKSRWKRKTRNKFVNLSSKPFFPHKSSGWRRTETSLRTGFSAAYKIKRNFFFGLAVLSFASLIALFIPGATLHLASAKQYQSILLQVTASRETNQIEISGIIPLYKQEITIQNSIKASPSGTILFPVEKAKGEVEITNLSQEMLSISSGTILRTANEPFLRFIVLEDMVLGRGPFSQAVVQVEAVEPGVAGNLDAGNHFIIENDAGYNLIITNAVSFTGGTERVLPSVTEDDVSQARNQLIAQMENQVKDDLIELMGEEQIIIEPSIELHQVVSETIDPPVGLPGSLFTITRECQYTAWFYKKSDLFQLFDQVVNANLPPGYQIGNGEPLITYSTEPSWDGISAKFNVNVQQEIVPGIDASRIALELQGLPIDYVSEVLTKEGILYDHYQLDVFPSWWKRMPFFPFRIQVVWT